MLRVKETFFLAVKSGPPLAVPKGQLVGEKDPVVKGREHLFEKVAEPQRLDGNQKLKARPMSAAQQKKLAAQVAKREEAEEG